MFFLDSQGRETSIPLAFTDLSSPDPWVVLGAGRSLFRVTDLGPELAKLSCAAICVFFNIGFIPTKVREAT
ncbi:MAG: hypothetical protein KDJ28_15965 [Candidatus Competibacteraceae bacterium]|nr:hypothetical protein [Candidatus Competibacteraceae bacterium]